MKIKTVTTKEIIEEKEIAIPSFWKYDTNSYPKISAIYSESKVVTVMNPHQTFADINMCKFESMYQPEKIFAGIEITEQEFNEGLARAIVIISGLEVCLEEKELQPA